MEVHISASRGEVEASVDWRVSEETIKTAAGAVVFQTEPVEGWRVTLHQLLDNVLDTAIA